MIQATELKNFVKSVFVASGFPKNVSEIAAETLLKADLRGIDSHGVARLSGYIRLVKAGRINPNAKPRIIHETPSTATFDADGGLGLWIAQEAMDIAIRKAESAGSGWVAVQNSSHFGIAAAHAEKALQHDMIGVAMTNASPLVAPAGKHKPFIADLATAAAANGKLEIAQRKGKTIPEGWALDNSGKQTTNPDALKEGGVLLPLGSDEDHGYHKGYALGSIVDILTGVLSGANFAGWVPPFVSFLEPTAPVGKGIGHFLGAWRIDAFQPADQFKQRMDAWIEGAKNLTKAEGINEILIPGEPESRAEEDRLKNGIPISEKVLSDMEKLAEEFDISMPSKLA
jgi:L-2-hydroxycarboxylate dehydrogenase (NAD+)